MPQPYDYSTQQVNVDNYFNSLRQGREDRSQQEAATRQSALQKYMPGALQGDAEDRAEVMKNANPEQQIALQNRFDNEPLQKIEQAMKMNGAITQLLSQVRDGDVQGFEAAKQRAAQIGIPMDQMGHLTVADLPRLRAESGQTAKELDIQFKQAQIAAQKANAAQSYAAADASRRSGQGGSAGQGGIDNKTFDNISSLRKEWQGVNKEFNTVKDAFGRIQATSSVATPAGDISMIYAYMKMLDPGSVVRETEFATAENAKPLLDRLGLSWDSVKNAWQGTRLQPAVRQDFLDRANELYSQQYNQYENNKSTYENLARRFEFDPELVVTDQTGGQRPSVNAQPTSFSGSGVFTDISQPKTVDGFTVRIKQ